MDSSAHACCGPGCCNFTSTSYVRNQLPILPNRGHSLPWDRYLDRVYGSVPLNAYPLDLSTFTWFYYESLPLEVTPSWLDPSCTSAFGHAWHGWPGCGQSGHGFPESQPPVRQAGFFVQQFDPRRPEAPRGIPNRTWVEVMRTAMARRTTESAGSWYWLARGSGVWLDLGRTYIDPEQRGESDWFFKKGGRLVRHLVNEGHDTLQFPRLAGTSTYTGAPVNNDRFELVALRKKPGLRGTCADEFRAGWAHDRACTCVEKVGVVNCRGPSTGTADAVADVDVASFSAVAASIDTNDELQEATTRDSSRLSLAGLPLAIKYWRDDLILPCPQRRHYVTFEPDGAGWNNVRLGVEAMLVVAGLTCRTLVLPPPDYINLLDKSKAVALTDVIRFHPQLHVITMHDFLAREADRGDGWFADEGKRPPAEVRHAARVRGSPVLWSYLRARGTDPNWRPGVTCILFGEASPRAGDIQLCGGRDIARYDSLLEHEHLLHFPLLCCCPLPQSTNASRKCDVRAWHRDLSRFAFPFYTFIRATDAATDRWAKRLVRDGMRYKDAIFSAAAAIIRRMRDAAASTGGTFASAHVRRGNLKHNEQISNTRTFEAIVDATQNEGGPRAERPLYLMTDVTSDAFFAPLRYGAVRMYQLSNFSDVLAEHGLQTGLHGSMVEQIVAAHSQAFVGTDTSTTTSYIVRLRGYLGRTETSSKVATLRRSIENLHEHAQPRPPFWDREWPAAWKFIEISTGDAPPVLPSCCHTCRPQPRNSWIREGVGVTLSEELGPATCAGLGASNRSAARAAGIPADVAACSCGFAAGETLCAEAIGAGREGVRTGVRTGLSVEQWAHLLMGQAAAGGRA